VVLVAGAILEQFLETAISSHFEITTEDARPLFDDSVDGPLSSFAQKISLGYALGVYGSEMRSDMTCIRHIRNAFAHSKERIDFETTEITPIFGRIILPKTRRFSTLSGNFSQSSTKIFASTIRLICAYFNDAQRPMKYKGSRFYALLYELPP
jgi:DNA-binding MltR family transcriptional regulator